MENHKCTKLFAQILCVNINSSYQQTSQWTSCVISQDFKIVKGNNACRFVKNMGATLIAYFVGQHLHPIPFPSTAEIKSNRSRASNPLNASMV